MAHKMRLKPTSLRMRFNTVDAGKNNFTCWKLLTTDNTVGNSFTWLEAVGHGKHRWSQYLIVSCMGPRLTPVKTVLHDWRLFAMDNNVDHSFTLLEAVGHGKYRWTQFLMVSCTGMDADRHR